MISRADCLTMDSSDSLGSLRERFELPEGLIYLDGNSLGPRAVGVRDRILSATEEWASALVAGWWEHDWVNLPRRVGHRLEAILGAEPGSVVCTDSTTVNLYKAINLNRHVSRLLAVVSKQAHQSPETESPLGFRL